MTKYCPVCFGEYKDPIATCPKDKARLVNEKPKDIERLVDIYAASDEIEAERIVSFLREENISSRISTSGISQLPVASDEVHIVSVVKESINAARALIERAREDNVISHNGNFL